MNAVLFIHLFAPFRILLLMWLMISIDSTLVVRHLISTHQGHMEDEEAEEAEEPRLQVEAECGDCIS